MSARRFSAVVCAALAVTFATSSAALAYASTGSYADDPCHSPGAIRGTSGNDTLSAPPNTTTPVVICGFGGDDVITGGSGNDILIGGPGNDTIRGGAGNDYIEGQGGNDTIYGEDGDDTILGQTGQDTIEGGAGSDMIDGGTGTDQCGTDDGDAYHRNCP
ncbi:MAG TPA: calcium-binding protein [Pseudonocardiaceae bacterium]|nr:calcium-binding protein [Pseudonocardiaceae bacterium]